MIKVEEVSSPQTAVNPLRHRLLMKCQTEWAWLMDADVVPTKELILNVQSLLGTSPKNLVLIGGLYGNSKNASLMERSYNRLCNLWSQANDVPLAGNLLIHKSVFYDHPSRLDQVPFGMEEYHLVNHARQLEYKIQVLDFKIEHRNGKNFHQFFERARSQIHLEKQKLTIPFLSYALKLLRSFTQAPLETLVVLLYLAMYASFSIRLRISKWIEAAPYKKDLHS